MTESSIIEIKPNRNYNVLFFMNTLLLILSLYPMLFSKTDISKLHYYFFVSFILIMETYFFHIIRSKICLTEDGIEINSLSKSEFFKYSDINLFFEEREYGFIINEVCIISFKSDSKNLVLSAQQYPKLIEELKKLNINEII